MANYSEVTGSKSKYLAGAVSRTQAREDTTIYVNATTGNDGYEGSSTKPFKTLQGALDYLKLWDGNGFNLTISVASGTYAPFVAGQWLNSWGRVEIIGDNTTPANCVIQGTDTATAAKVATFLGIDCAVFFSGFRLVGAASNKNYLFVAGKCARVTIGNAAVTTSKVEFGQCAHCLLCNEEATIYTPSTATITVDAGITITFFTSFGSDSAGSAIFIYGPVVFAGALTLTGYFFYMAPFTAVQWYPASFTGSGFSGKVAYHAPFGTLALTTSSYDALITAGLVVPTDTQVSSLALWQSQPMLLPRTKADLTAHSRWQRGQFAYCTDEAGGETIVFWDGTNWRRVADRNVMS
jgi:hypothetical protein